MRIIILTSLAVLIITTAMVGINMYNNPSLTIASINSETQLKQQDTSNAAKTRPSNNESPLSHVLSVTIKGVRNQRGQLLVQLFDNAVAFDNDQYDKALRTLSVPLKDFDGNISFDKILTGDYALTVMHDENQNQAFDTQGNFLEGYAYSNNVGHTQTATFAEAKFAITQADKKLVLNMIYHWGQHCG